MDFDDTREEASFRKEAREWLAAHAEEKRGAFETWQSRYPGREGWDGLERAKAFQSKKAEAHLIEVRPHSKIAGMISPSSSNAIQVNSSHHQSALVAGDGLAVVGVCEDDGVIEALELVNSDQFVIGVQWHPERTFGTDAFSRALFESFVAAASAWKLRPIQESVLSSR